MFIFLKKTMDSYVCRRVLCMKMYIFERKKKRKRLKYNTKGRVSALPFDL